MSESVVGSVLTDAGGKDFLVVLMSRDVVTDPDQASEVCEILQELFQTPVVLVADNGRGGADCHGRQRWVDTLTIRRLRAIEWEDIPVPAASFSSKVRRVWDDTTWLSLNDIWSMFKG
jgi:hypothetical protein